METITRQGSFDADLAAALNRNFSALTPSPFGKVWYVDGDNGSDAFPGNSTALAKGTIGGAIAVATRNDTIYIKARNVAAGGTDPVNYGGTVTIGPSQSGLKLIGVGSGLAQGAQPQLKVGTGSTAMITVQAPGCLIYGLTLNTNGSTGAGILLDDDGSTKSAFGTVIYGCVFKGAGASGNKSNLAASISVAATGGAWQCQVKSCKFVDCSCGINALGTSQAIVKDWLIQDCVFSSFANTDVDADINFNVGSGTSGIVIDRCVFATVDVPAYSTGNTARYIDLTSGVNGAVTNCTFACIAQGTSAKTWGAGGSAVKIPATVRWANCQGEVGATATVAFCVRS